MKKDEEVLQIKKYSEDEFKINKSEIRNEGRYMLLFSYSES
jgi:hypothetical protein